MKPGPSPAPPALRSSLSAIMLAAVFGCGPATIEAFDVAVTTVRSCTRNASSQQCVEPRTLAAQRMLGRWTVEHSGNDTFSLTDHRGDVVTGVTFRGLVGNLDAVLEGQPCLADQGICYFGRRRFQSTDPDNNDCTRFGQFVVVLRRDDDGAITARTSSLTGTDDRCRTSTITEQVEDITGALSPEPSLARAEAL